MLQPRDFGITGSDLSVEEVKNRVKKVFSADSGHKELPLVVKTYCMFLLEYYSGNTNIKNTAMMNQIAQSDMNNIMKNYTEVIGAIAAIRSDVFTKIKIAQTSKINFPNAQN